MPAMSEKGSKLNTSLRLTLIPKEMCAREAEVQSAGTKREQHRAVNVN